MLRPGTFGLHYFGTFGRSGGACGGAYTYQASGLTFAGRKQTYLIFLSSLGRTLILGCKMVVFLESCLYQT